MIRIALTDTKTVWDSESTSDTSGCRSLAPLAEHRLSIADDICSSERRTPAALSACKLCSACCADLPSRRSSSPFLHQMSSGSGPPGRSVVNSTDVAYSRQCGDNCKSHQATLGCYAATLWKKFCVHLIGPVLRTSPCCAVHWLNNYAHAAFNSDTVHDSDTILASA